MRRGASLPVVLPFLVAIGCGRWLVLPLYGRDTADGDPAPAVTPATVETPPSAVDTAAKPSTATAPAAEQGLATAVAALPAAGLRISAQSWRRAGLGSNAQVTFTLRNDNDYAVRDVEIACAFARRDGSHLTDRQRIHSGNHQYDEPEAVRPPARRFCQYPCGSDQM
jgi:hypothetical protein